MKVQIKEYQLAVDYCAFMVAILLARHVADESNAVIQWSAAELSEKLNKLPLAQCASYYVDCNALQHGLSFFQRVLNKRGALLIPVGNMIEPVQGFLNLVATSRTLKIKFLGYMQPPFDETSLELSDRILRIRNDLLSQSSYAESSHPSLTSLFSDLFLPMIISMRAPIEVLESIELDNEVQKITRN